MPLNYTFICEHCGKAFENKKAAYRKPRFCSKECFYNSNRSILICLQCGKKIKLPTKLAKSRRFCSQTCANRYNQPPDPTKKEVTTCETCGKAFKGWKYRNRRFCSTHCANVHAAHQPKPNARKPENFVTLNCEWCGKPYTVHKIYTEKRNSRFCSIECRANMMSVERRGNSNPMWTGGSPDPDTYGPNWGRQRRKAKKRDKHTCQVCGYHSGGSVILDVHHIKRIQDFNGDWKSANKLSNLITLCRICHTKIEHEQILCPTAD